MGTDIPLLSETFSCTTFSGTYTGTAVVYADSAPGVYCTCEIFQPALPRSAVYSRSVRSRPLKKDNI